MNRFKIIRILLVLAIATSLMVITAATVTARPNPASPLTTTTIRIEETVKTADAKRIGINLGHPEQYGAGNYMKNVISNPGFEGGELGMIFHVEEGATGSRIQHDVWNTNWNSSIAGQPVGFWDDAAFEILYGPARGRAGTIETFNHEDDKYTFLLDSAGTAPETGDVVAVRQYVEDFVYSADSFAEIDSTTTPTDSIGLTSMRLMPANASWKASYRYFMDSWWRQDQSAGKLFPIEGPWQLDFWAKGETLTDTLEVYFVREFETVFLNEVVTLTTEWQQYSFTFTVAPGVDMDFVPSTVQQRQADDFVWPYPPESRKQVDNPVLELGFRIQQTGGDVWLDDAAMYRLDHKNPTVFSDKFVTALRELQPGIVRDWGAQLGSSLNNQLAEPFARRPTGYSPKFTKPKEFHYSIHEFLELAQAVDAEPWYVIPPTFTPTELKNLVAYLSAESDDHAYANIRKELGQPEPWTTIFPKIHLEFANEAWGTNDGLDQFIGASLRGGVRVGSIANDRFAIMRGSPYFEADAFNLVIGGQYGDDFRQFEIESNSSNHDSIALAPYVGNKDSLNDIVSDEDIYYPVYARLPQDLGSGAVRGSQFYLDEVGQGTELAVYEFNFHTTFGDTPIDTRNEFVTGLNGALTLPLYMLTYQYQMGIRNQLTFQALQYSVNIRDAANPEYTRVWGMMRDLEATGRKRPTWLGVELANQGIMGDMLVTDQSGLNPSYIQPPLNEVRNTVEVPFVHSFAFNQEDDFSLILFNIHLTETHTVTLDFPTAIGRNGTLKTITSDSIRDNNEESEMIVIDSAEIDDLHQNYELALAPNSIVLLQWERGYEGMSAQPDVYSMFSNSILANPDSVLLNDTGPITGVLTATLALAPEHGTITLALDGSFVYTPTLDFEGVDSFIYIAHSNGEESNVGLVSIEVKAAKAGIYLPILHNGYPLSFE